MTRCPATGGNLASLGRRLFSLAYETLMLAAVLLPAGFAFLMVAGGVEPLLARPLLQVFLLLFAGTYFVWQWRWGGQTVAMKTWRIRVVTAAGESIELSRAVCRFLLATAGTLFFGTGMIWALFDRDGQFLHDRLAGTRIVTDEG